MQAGTGMNARGKLPSMAWLPRSSWTQSASTWKGVVVHVHATGATGAILTTRLLHAMRRKPLRRGVVTLCMGGGHAKVLAPAAP